MFLIHNKAISCVARGLALCAAGAAVGIAQAEHGSNDVAYAAAPSAGVGLPTTGMPATATPTTALSTTAMFSSAVSTGQTVHLMLGRSMYINTPTRLRRVYVSNPEILNSFTASPHQIVVTAKAAGVSSLIFWNEAGQSGVYAFSADLDVEGLRKSLEQALPGEDIQVEAREGKIYLAGSVSSEAASETALKLATLHSKDVANGLRVNRPHVKQVKLKVRFVEIDRVKLDQFGINIFSGGKNMSYGSTGQFPVTAGISTAASSVGGSTSASAAGHGTTLTLSDPLNLFFFNTDLNVGITIKDLENKQVLQILAEPSITTLSGQKASFLSGGEFPFPVVQGGSGGFSSVTIQFRDYGVKLDFLPIVNPDGSIQLKVSPEVSALDYTNAVTISGYTIPAISTRKAETQVELRDGQSFAISGLLDHRTTQLLGKVPGIGNLPILGELFKSKGITHSLMELIVIVTPMVVDPLTDTTAPVDPRMAVPNLEQDQFDSTAAHHKGRASAGSPGKAELP